MREGERRQEPMLESVALLHHRVHVDALQLFAERWITTLGAILGDQLLAPLVLVDVGGDVGDHL